MIKPGIIAIASIASIATCAVRNAQAIEPIATQATISAPLDVPYRRIVNLTRALQKPGITSIELGVAARGDRTIDVALHLTPEASQKDFDELVGRLVDMGADHVTIERKKEVPHRELKRFKELTEFRPDLPFTIELGRGSGMYGLDTIRISSDEGARLYRSETFTPKHSRFRSQIWYSAQLELPKPAIASIASAISEHKIMGLDRKYHANIDDGTQWVLRIVQGESQKAIYFNNRFPEEVKRLATIIDQTFDKNGLAKVKWSEEPAMVAGQHDAELWQSLRD